MTRVRPKATDMRSLKLSAEEGFLLSRVDAERTVRELVAVSGLDEERVLAILERLAAQGAVELPDRPAPPAPPPMRLRAQSFARIDELGELDEPGELRAAAEPSADADATRVSVSVSVAGVSDVGVVRTNNEDALVVMDLTSGEILDVADGRAGLDAGPRGVLLAISDGMGGANAGEVASALTLAAVEEHLAPNVRLDQDVGGRLVAAVEAANALVAEAAKEPGRDGMGATLVAVLVHGRSAHVAEVGDSRAYVLRRGALRQITKDQTQIQILLEQGLLTPETAKTSHAKNIVLQAVGKTPDLVVALRRLDLRDGDRLLLCSDGLTGHVADDAIAAILGSTASPGEACRALVAEANARGGRDNVTVIAAHVACPAAPLGDGADAIDAALVTVRAFSVPKGVA